MTFKTYTEAVNELVSKNYERPPGQDYWTHPNTDFYWAQIKPTEDGSGYKISYF